MLPVHLVPKSCEPFVVRKIRQCENCKRAASPVFAMMRTQDWFIYFCGPKCFRNYTAIWIKEGD